MRAVQATAAEAMSFEDLGALPLDLARMALCASGVLFYRHLADGTPTAVGGNLAPALPAYTRELLAEDPLQHAMRRAPLPAAIISPRTVQLDMRHFHESGAYADFYRRYEMEHLLGLSLTGLIYGAPNMTGILFTRSRHEPEFGDEEESLLAELAPSLRAALRRIERMDAARSGLDLLAAELGNSDEARVILDRDGELVWACPAARREAIDRSLDQLRRAVARWRSGAAVSEVIRGRRVAIAGVDEAGAVLLHLRPALRPDPMDSLTAAESRVLASLGNGLSNRAIAEALEVSVETVRTHVRRILAKLGVESRVEAALLWERRSR